MAATSCQIYFPPFFSSLWGFPSVHWLPNVCLCHWDLMAIAIITTSWVGQAVRPPPFISTKGFTTVLAFCLCLLVIYNPALHLSQILSQQCSGTVAEATGRSEKETGGRGKEDTPFCASCHYPTPGACAKSSELSVYVTFGPLRACATVTYWKEWPCKNHKNQKPWGSWNPHQAGHLQVLNGFLGSLHG